MDFSIHMGIPEMLELWMRLHKESMDGSISKADANLYKKMGQSIKTSCFQSILSKPPYTRNPRFNQTVRTKGLAVIFGEPNQSRHANVLGVWT